MKKLTKKSLDELAAVMPIISEKTQQECVGGTFYIKTAPLTFIGQVGLDDNINIVPDSTTSGSIRRNENLGVALSSTSYQQQMEVFSGYATVYFSGSTGSNYSGMEWGHNYSSQDDIYFNENTGKIVINQGASSLYYNSSLKEHFQNMTYSSGELI